jgi:carbamoyltransferase
LTKYVLGINAYDHDVSACLLRDGEIVAAISKERLTRVKHDPGFYQEVVDYCLAEAGISPARPDKVVLNTYLLPVPELERRLLSSHHPYQLRTDERERAFAHPYFRSDDPRVAVCSHHLAHAYSAFAYSPFESGAVMIVDGIGGYRADVTEEIPDGDDAHPAAREAESFYEFSGTSIRPIRKIFMGPERGIVNDDFEVLPGLGALYSRVSTYIFGNWNRCGEVMGLAPYGRPDLPPLVKVIDGELVFHPWPLSLCHPYTGDSDRDWIASPHRTEWEDLAFRVQDDVEKALIARAKELHARTGAENLVLAGGVALNCVANAKIVAETPFKQVFIQPAAGDDGIALGCAAYGHLELLGGERPAPMRSAGLGRDYTAEDRAKAVRRLGLRLVTSRVQTDDAPAHAARLIAAGKVIGWHQGRAEFGPRALGHRSILADPRDPKMKDRVNDRVKHRQGFRPFAPAILAERAAEYFEGEEESPFMILVKRVRPEMRDKIPSIVHVDGTARVQTVRREDNPATYDLIAAFEKLTGVPVVLNTSFNLRGEPIVETPEDAVDTFLRTHLDALVLTDQVIEKRGFGQLLIPIFKLSRDFRQNLQKANR